MLIVISSPKPIANEAHLINNLFDGGLKHFHLRKDSISEKEYRGIIEQIDPNFYDRLVIHQFHELTNDYRIQRIHYKEVHRRSFVMEDLHDLRSKGLRLSSSIHDLVSFEVLEGFEYVFYGPVYTSLSKPDYPGLSLDDMLLPAQPRQVKLIALGGIMESNLKEIPNIGFDGAALLGAIWNRPESAVSNFKSILKKWESSALS